MSELSLISLCKKFERSTPNEKVALDHISLEVNQGDFITILGSNGAGKSTLFNAILGKFPLDSGKIILDGENITKQKDYKRALNIGCLYQSPLKGTAPNMTIEENLALAYTRKAKRSFFAVNKKDSERFREMLSTLGLGLEDRMKTNMGLLSGGQRQAAALLMATIAEPKLLLLDEHTAALDPATADKVLALTKQIVEEQHLTCLMITHNMQSALDLGNRTIMMDRGRIILDVSGKERENLTVADLLEKFKVASGKGFDNDRMMLV
ncbi:MAG: ATP-binding cassette domain-containing protein [Lachnospiraceae bacterium]|nr:ATP-binding cassette domain-containing protein [Lachnospiraceae bacterium]